MTGLTLSERSAARHFTLFAALLAAAELFHSVQLEEWRVFSPDLLVSLTAIFCLLRPSDPRRLLLLLSAHLLEAVIEMPEIVNHWTLMTYVDVGVLGAVGLAVARRGRSALDPAALYVGLAPMLRLMVVMVYGFAAFAKLNSSFLDAELSCGPYMVRSLLQTGPLDLRLDTLDPLWIWGTIAVEAALPLLLLVRRTRLLGVAVGGVFHFTLFLGGHMPFSGFALAFYALFLPDDMPERFDRLVESRPWLGRARDAVRTAAHARVAFPLFAGTWLALSALITYGPNGDDVDAAVLGGAKLVFAVYYMALGAAFALCVLQGGPFRWRPGIVRLTSPVWLIGPLLVVANAASPYLGLKTQSTFTMYSNIQTEAGSWNHSLVPESVRIFGYQDDVVRIVSSSDEELAQAARLDRGWLLFALRQRVDDHPAISVTYIRDGERVVAPRAGDDPVLSDAPNPILGKIFLFRDVPPPDRNDCRQRRGAGAQQGS